MLHTQAFTCKNINTYTNYYGRRSGKFLIYLQPGYGSYFIRFYIKLNDCFDLKIMIVRIQYCADGTGDVIRIQ